MDEGLITAADWLERAKSLRLAVANAEHQLMSFLRRFELQEKPGGGLVWEDCGASTFEKLLVMHKLAAPERYREWVKATGVVGEGKAAKIGVPAAIAAAKITDPGLRSRYVDQAARRAEDEGFPWSDQQAKHAKLQYEPDPGYVPARDRQDASARARLEEKDRVIADLRSKLADALRENRELKRRLSKYEPEPQGARTD